MSGAIEWGGNGREPTTAESAFASALGSLVSGLDYWLHEDEDGSRWLLVSADFVEGNVVHDTLRLDVDRSRLSGGWSPASLNWDDGVRAQEAGIDTGPPDGINIDMPGASPAELAQVAAEWFSRHRASWAHGRRAGRRHRG